MSVSASEVLAATLRSTVPALVLDHICASDFTVPSKVPLCGVALFADISGFSSLCEHFENDPGSLLSTLNKYFSLILKVIRSQGGHVIDFAGDALICVFACHARPAAGDARTDGQLQATHALAAAFELQHMLHNARMTPETILSLKVGVGMGPASMFYVGGHMGRFEYFAAGAALEECFQAAKTGASGDVVVSSPVWAEVHGHCEGTRSESGHYLVRRMQQTVRKRSVHRTAVAPNLSAVAAARLRLFAPPALVRAAEFEALVGQAGRPWTISVVKASVLFVHFGIGGVLDLLDLDCVNMHKVLLTVQQHVHDMQGCTHRFTVDDKGCVMKVVFGANIPHEDQPYRAVLAALHIRDALSSHGIQAALGVASGECLIGPVGAAWRQEMTTHGTRVILAARLMEAAASFGGMVLCDDATHDATRDEIRFVRLRPLGIKGKRGLVQPYRPVASSDMLEKPMLRDLSGKAYCASGAEPQCALRRCIDWLSSPEPRVSSVVLSGSPGSGKTQLMMQLRAVLEPRCRVLHVLCRPHERHQQGALLRRLFAQLCGHDVWPSLRHLIPMLRPHATDGLGSAAYARASGLSPSDGDTQRAPCEKRGADMLTVALRVMADCAGDPAGLALLVDDVDHADAQSCEFLRRLAEAGPGPCPVLLLLTCREPRKSFSAPTPGASASRAAPPLTTGTQLVHKLARHARCMPLTLKPLDAAACARLACSTLGASTLAPLAASFVWKRGGGSPLLCQTILRTLARRGLVQVVGGAGKLTTGADDAPLDSATSAALAQACHSVLCVRLAELPMVQQLILKVLSVLPAPCPPALLLHAMPVPIDAQALAADLVQLTRRDFLRVRSTARRGDDEGRRQDADLADPDGRELAYADLGMREILRDLLTNEQRRRL